MEKMTGARIVIETLKEQGITTVFGYPGGQVLDIYDELYKAKGEIEHILTAHEQGAAHAADGYARACGEVGVVIATSGPGATNLVTGIATAMLDSVPMVAITGNVPSYMIGKDAFQEVNITGVTLPITKHNYLVSDVSELADTLREAFKIARSGRCGPVLVDIPKDIQLSECEFEKKEARPLISLDEPVDNDILKAVKLINESKKPYIYIGGGAKAAGVSEEIILLAEKIDAPIGCSLMGISVIDESYPGFLGMSGMHGRYASSVAKDEADLIIGIGVRFSDRATPEPEKNENGAKIIQLDADLAEINKNVVTDVGMACDIKSALNENKKRCKEKKRPKWRSKIEKLKEEERIKREERLKSAENSLIPEKIFEIINKEKDEDSIIATDVGQHQMWTAQFASFEGRGKFITSGGLGTMGYGLGASIGAFAASGKPVVMITGDGSFGMNLTELATAVTYNTSVVIVIMNNGSLGMVKQWQTHFFEGRHSSSVLNRKTDFVKISEGFGARAKAVETAEEFEEAFKEGFKSGGPYVIDVKTDIDELVYPMLSKETAIYDIMPLKEEGKQHD